MKGENQARNERHPLAISRTKWYKLDKDYNAETEGDKMYCEKCGMPVQDGSVFCAKCGASLNGGLNAQEQAELQRLKLQNERGRSVFYTILAFVLMFIGFSLAGGVGIATLGCVIMGILMFIIWMAKRRKQDKMQNPK
jgi:hypothetical protein